MIAGGGVYVNGVQYTKPSFSVSDGDSIEFHGIEISYVGRGGLKLEAALAHFSVDVSDYICLDVGASTGGFTDCLLRHGASRVFALDVGTLQLDDTLRADPRVISMENTDIRSVNPAVFEMPFDIVTIDVSFISLRLVIPFVLPLMRTGGILISLIKPQFEAGRQALSKRGVVLSEKIRAGVVDGITDFCTASGLDVQGSIVSPITGGSGNTEYLICCTKGMDLLDESGCFPEF